MFPSNARHRNRLAAYLLVLWGGAASACSPCHTQHAEVSYYEAYDSWEEICTGTGNSKICIPYVEHHQAQCAYQIVCDLRCEVLDKGKAEAHAKHQVLNLYGDKVDPRCVWQGGQAWVK